jgi:large subunit ribosomal protein L17
MRHNKKINHLGRTYSHRAALLSNMAVSLIMHKRIFTTLAKAKELRKYVEPIISKSKNDTTHSRRLVFQQLHDKYAVTELFQEISQKIGERPGGYTRIIKTGNRLGDNADMCFIELVDYNELMLQEKATKAKAATKTRRSRRGTAKAAEAEKVAVEETAEVVEKTTKAPKAKAPKKAKAAKEETPVVEEVVAEAPTVEEELPAVVEEVAEAPKAEEKKAEE